MAANEVKDSPEKEISEIDNRLDYARSSLDRLEKTASRLESALAPIIKKDALSEIPIECGDTQAIQFSPLGEELLAIQVRMNVVNTRINILLDALAI
jgi:hypothetical protein